MSNMDKSENANLSAALFALTLDPQGDQTLQAQLLQALKTLLSDQNHSGQRLPASRALAEELSVSRTTVQAVYDQMLGEGYLVARRGSGTFVADDLPHLQTPSPKPHQPGPGPDPWRPFRTGLPDQSLLPHRLWARHLERAWRNPTPALLGRPDPLGWYPLRQAIAQHLQVWRDLPCDPEQVVITSGAWESFELIFRGALNQHKQVAVEDPCWPKIHEMLGIDQIATYPVRIDSDGFDAQQIPPATSAVIVTPSRHYPTGVSMPLARRLALIDWARSTGGIVIEDDYDSEFRYRGQPLPSLCGLDGLNHSIYLGSFSKLISTTIRIGYIVLPRHHLDAARSYLRRVGNRASLVPQPALAGFLESGDFAVHLRRMRRVYAKRQQHLLHGLAPLSDLLDLQPDPSGMHLCLKLKPGTALSDQQISDLAQAQGLHISALSRDCTLPNPPQALLFGYAAFSEDTLTQATQQFITLMKAQGLA
jgi:GntR family transcriptional regulator/MocR family aminotransferase